MTILKFREIEDFAYYFQIQFEPWAAYIYSAGKY